MAIKVKVLKENKAKKIDESVIDMLSDPTMLAVGAGGLMFLYQALFGKKPDPEADLNRVRQDIERKIAQAEAGQKKYRSTKRNNMSKDYEKYKAKLRDLKRQKSMELPLSDVTDTSIAPATPTGNQPSLKDIQRYINVKALAMRATIEGEKINAMKKMKQMEEKFPGIENHPDVLGAEKLNRLREGFLRFL